MAEQYDTNAFIKIDRVRKILNVDLLDILVTKGQQYQLTDHDMKEAFRIANQERNNRSNDADDEGPDCISKEDFCSTVLFHEYQFQASAFQHLNEFLLYLPLFNLAVLQDVLHRIQENLGFDRSYVMKQLNHFYKTISDSPARRYADHFSYYCLTSPTIYEMRSQTQGQAEMEKLKRYEEWRGDADSRGEETAYNTAFGIFTKKLRAYDEAQYLMERIAQGDDL